MAPTIEKTIRKRGRPSGSNRTPLSLDEKRARNAQYERERREEQARGFADLAEAVGCDPNLTHDDILANVVTLLKRRVANSSAYEATTTAQLRAENVRLLAEVSQMEQLAAERTSRRGAEIVEPPAHASAKASLVNLETDYLEFNDVNEEFRTTYNTPMTTGVQEVENNVKDFSLNNIEVSGLGLQGDFNIDEAIEDLLNLNSSIEVPNI